MPLVSENLNGYLAHAQRVYANSAVAATSGAIAGAVLGGAAAYGISKASTTRRKSSRKKRPTAGKASKRPKKRSYKYARTAGKRRDTSTKRIRMTKNGQPYIILKSGKARFISKASARASRKRKGGRY